jgi:hypothetical protein
MHRLLGGILVLLLTLSVVADANGQDKPATPAEQHQALLREQDQLPDESSKAKTAEQRKQLRERLSNWTVAGFSERANTSFARAAGVK